MVRENPIQADEAVRLGAGGVRVDRLTEDQTVRVLMEGVQAGRGGWVVTANLDHLRRAGRDRTYRRLLGEADWVVADGMPLVWASRWRGTPLPERVAGSSMVGTIAEQAAARGCSLFLLGGAPGAASGAAAVLRQRHRGLRIAGTHAPPRGFERDEGAMETIRQKLQAAQPDVVYVALGSPKQERLIRVLRGEMPGVGWIGVGISLSFLAGQVRRAPRWMQRAGLEWVHRLAQEPRRLAHRYLVQDLPFALRLMAGAGWERLQGVGSPEAAGARAAGDGPSGAGIHRDRAGSAPPPNPETSKS